MKINRRQFIQKSILATGVAGVGFAVDVWAIEPHWVDVVEIDMPVRNLASDLAGLKIAHISDLHLSEVVDKQYLIRCFKKIESLEADVTVITGDYVTFTTANKYIEELIEIFSHASSPLGTFGCLGNHDYGVYSRLSKKIKGAANKINHNFEKTGVQLLRNKTAYVEVNGSRLWIAGLGDIWAKDCDTQILSTLPEDEPGIVLLHNPDGVANVLKYNPDAVLCGHTHGGQVRVPFVGALLLPIEDRRYDAGQFYIDDTFVYVNRGLGLLPGITGTGRFNCRPEITLYTLKSA